MFHIFNKTTMRRAVIEALIIFIAGTLLALVPIAIWPAPIFPLVLILRLFLFVLPPVWAAKRVISTRREKMSRRFWLLGPGLALLCGLANLLIALFLGESLPLGGPAGPADITRFSAHGAAALAPGVFALSMLQTFGLLVVYYTIAVVCTRLANGGFMRFTMPAGNGRVTL